jgi:hypothetical protein
VENNLAVPPNLPYALAISFLVVYPKELKEETNRYLYTMYIAALFTTAKMWKQCKRPSTDAR